MDQAARGLDRETGGEEEVRRRSEGVFEELKPYCLDLLELLHANPADRSPSSITSLLRFLRTCPSSSLQPFFDYTLFPLLLLLDAAVNCRGSKKSKTGLDEEEKLVGVSDRVAEGVVLCLEELLLKCRLASVDQMVLLMKKLTHAALLSPAEASEEFREGVIRCFRALLVSLVPCGDDSCSCRGLGVPALMETGYMRLSPFKSSECCFERGECLVAFLQSPTAAAAVGHWLSLLLKSADAEAVRGHRGSASIRVEAFLTLRFLVAKVGDADALAFYLPGVVSQLSKVLHISKTMISGAAGSVEATDQALRGLAEYLMIVLNDGANPCSINFNVMDGVSLNEINSAHSILNELRQLPIIAKGNQENLAEQCSGEADIPVSAVKMTDGIKSGKEMGTLHVKRTEEWIEKTSAHVDKLLAATFPQLCVHSVKKLRKGLLAAIRGLLSNCNYTLKSSRLMFLECLFVLIVDDSLDVSTAAQEFLDHVVFEGARQQMQQDISEIFSRLIDKLPKVVLGNEEWLAVSHVQKLFTVVYYSGPEFVLDNFRSPVMTGRFLDLFALCLSPNSAYAGTLDKLVTAKSLSVSYIPSINELKDVSRSHSDEHILVDELCSNITKFKDIPEKVAHRSWDNKHTNYELPRMPPWFANAVSQKLYQALAGILRLIGLSLTIDFRKEACISGVTDIPLSFIRKLVSEVRAKEYREESWHSWYYRNGSGQLLRQASTAACILNEVIFGMSNGAMDTIVRMLGNLGSNGKVLQDLSANTLDPGHQSSTVEHLQCYWSIWKVSERKSASNHMIECIGEILHEYLSPEIWILPVDGNSNGELQEITLHFSCDAAMLQQVMIEGIGVFALCLGKDFASSGFLHSSLYLLLEVLVCSNFQVRGASDAVLHILSAASGYSTVGELVLENADYVIDSISRQLRHLDLNPHSPAVLASMLSYVGVAQKILPLLEEPMHYASQELEIIGRHQHPELTIPFLKAVAEIVKASKREASLLPTIALSHHVLVKSKIAEIERLDSGPNLTSHDDGTCILESEWENLVLKLNDSRRYRRIVGSTAGSCLVAATPLLSSTKQDECLVALDIIEDGIATLAKVEEAFRQEKETREVIEELIESHSLYRLQDIIDATEEGTDENRLLPAMNKLWPFLVSCVRNGHNVAVRRCLSAVANVVQHCGGDFFSRRFHTDGPHFWKLLSACPFHRKPFSRSSKKQLQLPYRSSHDSSENSMAETSNMKVQVAALNMIACLSRDKGSTTALEMVLKKVSGLVVGIACSGVAGLREASTNALMGLASIDPDLIWLLLADVYYSTRKKDLPRPPTPEFPDISSILPPSSSPKQYLYVQYGGKSSGFDIDISAVEAAFKVFAHPTFYLGVEQVVS